MSEPTNAVLAERIEGVHSIVLEIKKEMQDHVQKDDARIVSVEKWIWMVTGVIIFMNTIFVPIAIWAIITLVGKVWH